MGLLDRFKGNKEPVKQEEPKMQQRSPYDVSFSRNGNGSLQVDFHDRNADFKQFYDTTRLIIAGEVNDMGPVPLKDCFVSWYGEDDAVMIDKDGNEHGRKTDYKNVLAEIDPNLLQTDPSYCATVMKKLLDRKRVEEYLTRGMQENPEVPCGEYVGGVRLSEGQYKKVFDVSVGKISHNSPKMQNARIKNAQIKEQRRQQAIEERQRKIEELQGEIDGLSK